MKTYLSASLSAILLMGCGGGDQSFSDLESSGNRLIDKLDQADVTPINSMPDSGSATYTGVAAFIPTSNGFEILSELSINANFSTGAITGKLDNFRDSENASIEGVVGMNGDLAYSLDGYTYTLISGGGYDSVPPGRYFPALLGDLNGMLRYNGSELLVDGRFQGTFGGANSEFVGGVISGSVGEQYVDGIFGAEK